MGEIRSVRTAGLDRVVRLGWGHCAGQATARTPAASRRVEPRSGARALGRRARSAAASGRHRRAGRSADRRSARRRGGAGRSRVARATGPSRVVRAARRCRGGKQHIGIGRARAAARKHRWRVARSPKSSSPHRHRRPRPSARGPLRPASAHNARAVGHPAAAAAPRRQRHRRRGLGALWRSRRRDRLRHRRRARHRAHGLAPFRPGDPRPGALPRGARRGQRPGRPACRRAAIRRWRGGLRGRGVRPAPTPQADRPAAGTTTSTCHAHP